MTAQPATSAMRSRAAVDRLSVAGNRATWTLAGRRAGLAAVSREGGDGVAHVARLLDRALADLTGADVYSLDVGPASDRGVSLWERASFARRLAAAQVARRVDWFVFSHLALARAQRVIPASWRRPYAVFLHGVEAWGPTVTAPRLASLRHAALLLSNSHYTAGRFEARFPGLAPVVACQLSLLPLDSAAPAAAADEGLLARVAPRSAMIVGRMSSGERYKGHDELLECWPAVQARIADAQLVVVGDGDDARRLRAKAESLGVADSVLFAGRVSDATLRALYERTALFAMPSRGEGFGVVYLEAMRAGRACIASAQDGATDVVADGETGLLVPQRDVRALAAALSTLLADPARADALGRAGRVLYERHFTFERFRDRLAAALAPVFGAPPGGGE